MKAEFPLAKLLVRSYDREHAHELIKAKAELNSYDKITEKHLSRLNDKIERALASARQLDL